MSKIRHHVNILFEKVPNCEQKENIIQEIVDNLEDKVNELITTGIEENEAINKAIADFGDIDEIKNELLKDKKIQKQKNASINFKFSLFGSGLIILLFVFINLYYTPKTIWFVYPVFVTLWWPLSMMYVLYRIKENGR